MANTNLLDEHTHTSSHDSSTNHQSNAQLLASLAASKNTLESHCGVFIEHIVCTLTLMIPSAIVFQLLFA